MYRSAVFILGWLIRCHFFRSANPGHELLERVNQLLAGVYV
jgi:hypothetical protein